MTDRLPLQLQSAATAEGDFHVHLLSKAAVEAWSGGGSGPLAGDDATRALQLLEHARFDGASDQSVLLPLGDGGCAALLGVGAEADAAALRRASARAIDVAPREAPWSLLPPSGTDRGGVVACAEGLLLGTYRFERRLEPKASTVGPCTLVASDGAACVAEARAVTEGVALTRDLVNAPANELGPQELADAALEVAERHGLKAHAWRGDEVLAQGFRLVDAVGRASTRPPSFTVVQVGDPDATPELALVGKGVVFDSGGLGIKPAGGMQLMRKDMGGAGTCIGALDAAMRLGVELPMLVVVPSAENSIGGDAFRPGDILRSHDGLTVEIGHTDAEGRLLLADALSYSRGRGARRLLDVATLTGAARVALGPDVPALFGNDEELVADLLASAAARDEQLWRMPLVEAYEKTIDTPWADVNNSASDRRGGAITAALFLRRFARSTPWAHIDVYAWEDSGKPGTPKGANGMTVPTIVELLRRRAGA